MKPPEQWRRRPRALEKQSHQRRQLRHCPTAAVQRVLEVGISQAIRPSARAGVCASNRSLQLFRGEPVVHLWQWDVPLQQREGRERGASGGRYFY
jgi:hypothetical protein